MSVGLLDAVMAKKNISPVKLPADVVESARIVSALNGETMADLIAGILRPVLADMERDLLAQRSRQIGPAESPPARPKRGGKP
jgi:hypothetical protein